MAMQFVAASSQLVAMGSGNLALAAVNGATLMAWVNPPSLVAGARTVIGLSNGLAGGTSRAKLGIVNTTGNIRANGRCLDADANQVYNGPNGDVVAGSWRHLVAVFDYTNKLMMVYSNGVLTGTSATITGWGTAPTSNTASVSFGIGAQHGGGSEFLTGGVDDARVYNRVLSSDEIQTIYECRGLDGIADGLTNRYLLEEGAPTVVATGAVIKDIAGGMTGTPANSPVWDASEISYAENVR